MHQILLSRYFRRGAKVEDVREGSVPGRPHRVLLGYNRKSRKADSATKPHVEAAHSPTV